jgi:hypothetical protein
MVTPTITFCSGRWASLRAPVQYVAGCASLHPRSCWWGQLGARESAPSPGRPGRGGCRWQRRGGADAGAGGRAGYGGRHDFACRGRCGCFAGHPPRPSALVLAGSWSLVLPVPVILWTCHRVAVHSMTRRGAGPGASAFGDLFCHPHRHRNHDHGRLPRAWNPWDIVRDHGSQPAAAGFREQVTARPARWAQVRGRTPTCPA